MEIRCPIKNIDNAIVYRMIEINNEMITIKTFLSRCSSSSCFLNKIS